MKRKRISKLLLVCTIFMVILNAASTKIQTVAAPSLKSIDNNYLTPGEYQLLDQIFRTHLNYFLSADAVAQFGLPLTAFKVGDRSRFGYSNPTEWGYVIQAWMAAAERGVITYQAAEQKILNALNTLDILQNSDTQNYQGLFYPYYKVTDPQENDLLLPYQDGDSRIPSGDDALLYASLLVTEGWAHYHVNPIIEALAKKIKDRMQFRQFLVKDGGDLYLAHQIDAKTNQLSVQRWEIYADEAAVVAWVAYISGAVSFAEYQKLIGSMRRAPAFWQSCQDKTYIVPEAAKYNTMFPWGVRSYAGFPVGKFDTPQETRNNYSKSIITAAKAHLDYGGCLNVDYPGFSDAMTQTGGGVALVGGYVPPNLDGVVPNQAPEYIVPYAFFVPFNALPELDVELHARLILKINQLIGDQAGYYHNSGGYPYGFEVVASPYADVISFPGADDGRLIFETLSEAYVVLSLFNTLQLDDDGPTFVNFALELPGVREKMIAVLDFLYPPPTLFLPLINTNYPPLPEWHEIGTFNFSSSGISPIEERSIRIPGEFIGSGPNTILIEVTDPPLSNHWLIWDSLDLKTADQQVIWVLGENEAPPDYSPTAYDEFDPNSPFAEHYTVGVNPVSDFPKEINDSSLAKIYIHFTLPTSYAGQAEYWLFLDTIFASHDDILDCNLKVSVIAQ